MKPSQFPQGFTRVPAGRIEKGGSRIVAALIALAAFSVGLFVPTGAWGKASTFIRRAQNVEGIVTAVYVSSAWGDTDYNFNLRPPQDAIKAERFMNLFWVPDRYAKSGGVWLLDTYLDYYAEWINDMSSADYTPQCRACAGTGPMGTGCHVDTDRYYARNPCGRLYKCWQCMRDVARKAGISLSRLYPQVELFIGDDDNEENSALREVMAALGARQNGCDEYEWKSGTYVPASNKNGICGKTVRLSGWVTVDRQHESKPELHPVSQLHVHWGGDIWRIGAFVDGSTEPGWITWPPWDVIQKIWTINYRDELSSSDYPGSPIIDLGLLQPPPPSASSWGSATTGGTDVIEARCYGPDRIPGLMSSYHLTSAGVRLLPSTPGSQCGRLQVHLDRGRDEGAAWVGEVTAGWRRRRYDVRLKTELLTPGGILTDNPLRPVVAHIAGLGKHQAPQLAGKGILAPLRFEPKEAAGLAGARDLCRSYVDLSERLEALGRDLGCHAVGDYTREQHASWCRGQQAKTLAHHLEMRKRRLQACLNGTEFAARGAQTCANYGRYAARMEAWRREAGCAGPVIPEETHRKWCLGQRQRMEIPRDHQRRRAGQTVTCILGMKLVPTVPVKLVQAQLLPAQAAVPRCEVRSTEGALFRWYRWRITLQLKIPDEEFVELSWKLFTEPNSALVVPDVRSSKNIRKVKTFDIWVPVPVQSMTWNDAQTGEISVRVFRRKAGQSTMEVAHDRRLLSAPRPPAVRLVPQAPTLTLTRSGPVYRLALRAVPENFCGDAKHYRYDWFVMNTPPGSYSSWGVLGGSSNWGQKAQSSATPPPPQGAGPAPVTMLPGQGFTYRLSVQDPWGVETAYHSLYLAPPHLRLHGSARCADKEVNHPKYGKIAVPTGATLSYNQAFSVPAQLQGANPASANGTVGLCRSVVLNARAVEDVGRGARFPSMKDLRLQFRWQDLSYRKNRWGPWVPMPESWYTVAARGTTSTLRIHAPPSANLFFYQATLVAKDQWGRQVAGNYYGTNDFSFPDQLNKRLKALRQAVLPKRGPVVPCAACDRGPKFRFEDEIAALLYRTTHQRRNDPDEIAHLRADVTAFMHRALNQASVTRQLGANVYRRPRRPVFRIKATRFAHGKVLRHVSSRIAGAQLLQSQVGRQYLAGLRSRHQALSRNRAQMGRVLAPRRAQPVAPRPLMHRFQLQRIEKAPRTQPLGR